MRTTLRQISVVYHKLCDYVNEPQAPHFSKDYLKEITMLLVWLHFRSLSEVWFWPLVHWIPASVSEQPHNFLYFREKIITGRQIWWVGLVATKDGVGLHNRTRSHMFSDKCLRMLQQNSALTASRTNPECTNPWMSTQRTSILLVGLLTLRTSFRLGHWATVPPKAALWSLIIVIARDLTREYYCIQMKFGLVWHMSGVLRSVREFQVTI